MSKPTLVYVVLLTVCAGGLWGILRAGSTMSAVSDLTGTWQIEGGPLGPAPGGPDVLGENFVLDQSGRFVRIKFERGRVLDLKATSVPTGAITQPVPIEFAGGEWRLTGTVRPEGKGLVASLTLTGPRRTMQFTARRPGPGPVEPEPPAHPGQKDGANEGPQPAAATADVEPAVVTADPAVAPDR